jgi:outer membrane lipoprotein carrier protein
MRILCLFALTAALALAPAAEASTAEQIVSSIDERYQGVTAIQARFIQTINSPAYGENVQTGALQLKRPQKARWEFMEPTKSAMITNGQTMWIYTPEANQVIVTEDLSSSGGGSGLMVLLTDLSRIEEFFTVEAVAGGESEHALKLVPKEESLRTQLKDLQLVLDGSYVIKRVSFADSFGQTTTLEFSEVALNPTLTDEQFDFSPPEGTTIINSGGL